MGKAPERRWRSEKRLALRRTTTTRDAVKGEWEPRCRPEGTIPGRGSTASEWGETSWS